MRLETIQQLEADGHVLIYGDDYVVVDHGMRDTGHGMARIVSGIGLDGEPELRQQQNGNEIPVIMLSGMKNVRIYKGNSVVLLKSRMKIQNPHVQQGTIDDDGEDIDTAIEKGKVFGIGVAGMARIERIIKREN